MSIAGVDIPIIAILFLAFLVFCVMKGGANKDGGGNSTPKNNGGKPNNGSSSEKPGN